MSVKFCLQANRSHAGLHLSGCAAGPRRRAYCGRSNLGNRTPAARIIGCRSGAARRTSNCVRGRRKIVAIRVLRRQVAIALFHDSEVIGQNTGATVPETGVVCAFVGRVVGSVERHLVNGPIPSRSTIDITIRRVIRPIRTQERSITDRDAQRKHILARRIQPPAVVANSSHMVAILKNLKHFGV